MCLTPVSIKVQKKGQIKIQQVPCGKCLECVKRFQNHWRMRLSEEAKQWRYCYFLTLTYSNDNLPYVKLNWLSDEYNETDKIKIYGSYRGAYDRVSYSEEEEFDGELSEYDFDDWVLNEDKVIEYRSSYVLTEIDKMPLSKALSEARARTNSPYTAYLDVNRITDDILIPMVSRIDIQLWLKRARIKWLRTFGEDCKFKYFLCSEYGPQTLRPHYHILFFADFDVYDLDRYFVYDWEKNYGRVDWTQDCVKTKSSKMSLRDAQKAVANYVAKYCCKPAEFENPYVVAGIIPHTFRMCSKGIGAAYREELMKRVDKLKERIPVYRDEFEFAFCVDEFETKDDKKIHKGITADVNKDRYYPDLEDILKDMGLEYYGTEQRPLSTMNKHERKVYMSNGKMHYLKEMCHSLPSSVNPDFIKALAEELRYYDNGFFYGLPRYWRDVVFPHTWREGTRYNKKTKQVEKYKRYEKDTEHNICVAYTQYMEDRYIENLLKYEERARSENPDGEDMDILHQAEVYYQQDIKERQRVAWQSLYKRYYKNFLKNEL